MLQQHKLIEGSPAGADKRNLTSNAIVELEWTDETRRQLQSANDALMAFGDKIASARSKLIAHTDLPSRMDVVALGAFTQDEEVAFWQSLQQFVNIAHGEAVGGPFEIDAPTVDGDINTLLHCLVDAVDYSDLAKDDGFLLQRMGKQRYRGI